MVAKSEAAKFNLTLNRRLCFYTVGICNRRLDGKYGIHPSQAGCAALIQIDYITERDQRPDQAEEIHIEDSKLPDRNLSPNRCRYPGPDDQYEAHADQKLHERAH